jgi:predicted membrane-bound mannosyltransferase
MQMERDDLVAALSSATELSIDVRTTDANRVHTWIQGLQLLGLALRIEFEGLLIIVVVVGAALAAFAGFGLT